MCHRIPPLGAGAASRLAQDLLASWLPHIARKDSLIIDSFVADYQSLRSPCSKLPAKPILSYWQVLKDPLLSSAQERRDQGRSPIMRHLSGIALTRDVQDCIGTFGVVL